MFGYLKPETPYLYIKDDTLYKALYCGVCKSIGRTCSQEARLSLTYDIAFFSAVVHNLAGEDVKISKQRCVTHWIKKRPMVEKGDRLTDLCAQINVELAYYKIKDDILDGNGGKGKLLFFKKSHKRVLKQNPQISQIIERNYSALFELEKQKCSSIDRVCEPFSQMMVELAELVLGEKATESVKKLFYFLGKWIYLIDALDDYQKDVKEKAYNPLYYAYGEKDSVREVFNVNGKDISFAFSDIFANLKMAMGDCRFYFNHDLIDNIILGALPPFT
jgi:hypothetical protein